MLLYPYNIINYCFQKNHLSFDDVINGNVATVERTGVSLRNNTFQLKVTGAKENNYFIKQPKFLLDRQDESILSEYQFYDYINNNDQDGNIKKMIPTLKGFDSYNRILVQGYIDHQKLVVNLYSSNDGCPDLIQHPPETVFEEMTKAFALSFQKLRLCECMTKLFIDKTINPNEYWNMRRRFKPEWLIEDESILQRYINSQDTIQKTIGNFMDKQEIREIRKKLSDNWQFSHLIHGDIQFDNLIMFNQCQRNVYFVDWELVAYGNPFFDAASFISEIWKNYINNNIMKNFTRVFVLNNTKTFIKEYLSDNYNFDNAVEILQLAALQTLFWFDKNSNDFIRKDLTKKIGIAIRDIHQMLTEPNSFLPTR